MVSTRSLCVEEGGIRSGGIVRTEPAGGRVVVMATTSDAKRTTMTDRLWENLLYHLGGAEMDLRNP
jgi:hypothetical protein